MIKGQDGAPVRLSRPNPLMEGMSQPRETSEAEFDNWENFGSTVMAKIANPLAAGLVERAIQDQPQVTSPQQSTQEQQSEPPRSANSTLVDRDEDPLYDRTHLQDAPPKDEEMIRNPDGTIYKPSGNVRMFDPQNREHLLVDDISDETITLSGAPVKYHRVIIDSNMDPLYFEQRGKLFFQEPFDLCAVYDPVVPVHDMGFHGLDSTEQLIFTFGRRKFIEKVGEMPRVGSIIATCDEPNFWEILQIDINLPDERKMWGKHLLACLTQKYIPTRTDYSPSRQGREAVESGRDDPRPTVRVR